MNYSIRNATIKDLDKVLTLNESVVPHVNSISLSDMHDFLEKAVYFRVACDEDNRIVAFLIGLDPNTRYESLNYRWFCSHFDEFAYIDRIAVATNAQRLGIAEALYSDLADRASDWARQLVCEVNLRPANPGSMAFHQRLGFNQVGTQETLNGSKKVAFLLKKL